MDRDGNTYKLLLGVAVSIVAGSATSVAVVLIANLSVDGGDEWRFLWMFSLPGVVIGGLLSPFVVDWYKRPLGRGVWVFSFLVHSLAVAIACVGVVWILGMVKG